MYKQINFEVVKIWDLFHFSLRFLKLRAVVNLKHRKKRKQNKTIDIWHNFLGRNWIRHPGHMYCMSGGVCGIIISPKMLHNTHQASRGSKSINPREHYIIV